MLPNWGLFLRRYAELMMVEATCHVVNAPQLAWDLR